MSRICFLTIGFALIGGQLFAQDVPSVKKYMESRHSLGTVISLDVCYSQEQWPVVKDAVRQVWERMDEINIRMNPYDEKSDIVRINRAQGACVKVNEDVYALLQRSVAYKHLTDGVFDVTITPLTKLWQRAVNNGRVPSSDDIEKEKNKVNADGIIFSNGNQVRLVDPQMAVDLGGNAQGYAADEAVRILKAAGLRRFLMDAGGELFASGFNCEGSKWRIGVKDSVNPQKFDEIIELENAAVSTSGSYEKYFKINEEKWSHIINPVTGYPAQEVVAATVIAPTATDADVLSTALCVLGAVKGLELIGRMGAGYSAVIYSKASEGVLMRMATNAYDAQLGEKH